MPTVSARIDAEMTGGDLVAKVSAQTGHLASAATLLADLAAAPPQSLGELVEGLGAVELPQLDVAADLTTALEGLRAALPADFAVVIEGAVTVSGSLKVIVDGELVPQIEKLVSGLTAIVGVIDRLSSLAPEADAEATAAGAPPAAPGGGAGTEGGTPPPTPAEERRAARAAAVAEVAERLEALPEPLDAPTVVSFAQAQLSLVRRELVPMPYVPLFDDLLFLFDTTMDLQDGDAAFLEAHVRDSAAALASFLGLARAPVDDLAAALASLRSDVDLTALATRTRTVIDGLGRIAAAVRAGHAPGGADLASVGEALDGLLPQLAALNEEPMRERIEDAGTLLEHLVGDVDAALRRVAHATLPPGYLGLFGGVGAALEEAVKGAGLEELGEEMRAFLDAAADSLDRADLGALVEPVESVVEELQSACAEIDAVLATVASEAAALFDEVDSLLDEIDLQAITDAVSGALGAFVDGLQARVDALFAPVDDALSAAIGTISQTLDQFDPEDVIAALTDAIDALENALTVPEVTSAIEGIKSTIEGVAGQVRTVSFSPITDGVVATIEEITAALRKVDPATLSPAVTLALNAAVALLPEDLTSVTDPLEADFGVLIDTGPRPLLESIREQPALLLDRIKAYGPAQLIGTQLSGPFDALVASLESIDPTSDLLAPVQEALEGFAAGLREAADPSALVAPLQPAYDEIVSLLGSADPSTLVAPVQAALDSAVAAVTGVLPVDEAYDAVFDVAARVRGVLDLVTGIRTIVAKTAAAAASLTDTKKQLRDWIKPVIEKVDGIAGLAGVQSAFDDVNEALDALSADALEDALDAPLVPLRDALVALAPATSLASLSTVYRAIDRLSVQSLAASPERAALLALLDRLDPLDVAFAAPYRRLQAWSDSLARDDARWRAFLPGWARRVASAHGPLAGLRHAGITKTQLKEVLRAGFEDEIVQPLAAVLDAAGAAATAVAIPLEELVHFAEELEAKLESLLAAPEALAGVRSALDALLARIGDVDVGFIVDELQGVLDAVMAKLAAIDPHAIGELLGAAFDDVLAALDVTALLPADDLAALDESYRHIVDGLKELDPTALVVDVVQPVFDERILPIVAAFDITVVIEALIETLDALRLDLGLELDRVNEAYKEMLDAVPPFSPFDISLEVDIDVDIDVGF